MRHKAKFGVRVLGWVAIAIVTLELCARTEDKVRYGAPFFGNYSADSLYTYDALGKYGHPNASFQKWHLNEAGYRGPALRDGTYRIACLGSSETFGLYESPGNEWPRQLESILNHSRGSQAYEVIDVAFPGMSLATDIKRLPQIISTLHPKMAVIYPSYTPYIEIDHPFSTQSNIPAATVPPATSHFEWRIAGRFDTLMKSSLPEGLQHKLRSLQIQHDIRGKTVMERLPEQNVQAFQSDLDSLTTQLLSSGVQVVLVTHANRFGPILNPADRPILTDWRKFFPTLQEDGLLDMERRMSGAVRQVGQTHNVPVVDAAALIAPGRGDFAEFVHFTDAGANALATIVAAQIQREPDVENHPPASR
jgi:hypothetical protein